MLKIGPLYIATRTEFDHALIDLSIETASEYLDLVDQNLLRACMAADALFHRIQAEGHLRPADQVVCDQLVEAIGQAQNPQKRP